jgi:hypothetical protein
MTIQNDINLWYERKRMGVKNPNEEKALEKLYEFLSSVDERTKERVFQYQLKIDSWSEKSQGDKLKAYLDEAQRLSEAFTDSLSAAVAISEIDRIKSGKI